MNPADLFAPGRLAELAAITAAIDGLDATQLQRALWVKLAECDRAQLATVAGFVLGMRGDLGVETVERFVASGKGQGAH